LISALTIGLFVLLVLVDVPVSAAIGAATITGLLAGGYDLLSLPQHMAASVKSIELMAIPFFILAAALMNSMQITERIFDFANALVGGWRGGLAYSNVIAGMIFSGISGAAVADAAALGAISMKEMPRAGYPAPFSAALVIAVSTLGPIIPPSIMMVVYAITANVSIGRLFIAGVGPGIVIGGALMALIWAMVRMGWVAAPAPKPFDWRQLATITRKTFLALLAPAVILFGMISGWVTPTEAGIMAVFYALFVGAVYRTVTWRGIVESLETTVEASALILYIIAVSSALSYLFISEGSAEQLSKLMASLSAGKWSFLLIANVLLLVLGFFIETLPAMLIAVPLLMPTALNLGVDPTHFGVVVIFNLMIGIMHPPIGIGLFVLIAISKVPYGKLAKAAIPFIVCLLIVLVIITLVPEIAMWLPDRLMPDPAKALQK
jgi:tripartite ATP-independent transporter DctM subunit